MTVVINDGSALQDTVASLLAASGHEVQREQILGHKKVDLLCQERTLARRVRYAVECKDYGKPLTKDELLTIVVDYQALIDSNLIDELLVVTSRTLQKALSRHGSADPRGCGERCLILWS